MRTKSQWKPAVTCVPYARPSRIHDLSYEAPGTPCQRRWVPGANSWPIVNENG